MIEIIILCEGKTEQNFCNKVISRYLYSKNINLRGTLAGAPGKKGGIKPWEVYKRDLSRLAQERHNRYIGVLVDYYAMPGSWPGRTEAKQKAIDNRGIHIENSLRDALPSEISSRFIPCVQLHEFEALLFAAPDRTARSWEGLGSPHSTSRISTALQSVLEQYRGFIEHINDSPSSAPSKRIEKIVPSYDKIVWGLKAIEDIGLSDLRASCPWLDRWLSRLEGLTITEE